MLLSEHRGVGILNHVWTVPEERSKGASSTLMQHVMDGFKIRQGKMMVLQTGFDSVAYHMYRKFGFESLEPKSGYMHWYTDSEAAFYDGFFAASDTQILPLNWPHWLLIQPLLQGDFGDVIRSLSLKQVGRRSTESAILSLLRDIIEQSKRTLPHRVNVLQCNGTGAIGGFAMWDWHPLWIDTCLIDLYCHPTYWKYGKSLLEQLNLPRADRYVAFADANQLEKQRILQDRGFSQVTVLKSWAAVNSSKTSFVDVLLYEMK
jgi:hypothetical protein